MFTGIIESLGVVEKIHADATNIHITIASPISHLLKIDQSLAHQGVCLTVIAKTKHSHTVTAIDETMKRTNLHTWKVGNLVNLERAMLASARLDGHIVQGHVDTTGVCIGRENHEGSWIFTFQFQQTPQYFVVDKGSICINGTSLTVCNPQNDTFSVAIIPYTIENTTFKDIEIGSIVNLEFDIIGKYLAR